MHDALILTRSKLLGWVLTMTSLNARYCATSVWCFLLFTFDKLPASFTLISSLCLRVVCAEVNHRGSSLFEMQWLQKPLVIFLHNTMFLKACSLTVVPENRSMVLLAAGYYVGDNYVSSCELWVGVLPDLTPQLAYELDCNLGRLSCLALLSDATFSFNWAAAGI